MFRGDLLVAGDRRAEAAASYLEASRWAPTSPRWPLEAARQLGHLQRWAETARALERVVEIAPDHAEALGRLGMAYMQLDRLDDAEAVLLRAQEIVGSGDLFISGAISELRRRNLE